MPACVNDASAASVSPDAITAPRVGQRRSVHAGMSLWNNFGGHCEVIFADGSAHPFEAARAAITHNGRGLFGSLALTPVSGRNLDAAWLANRIGEEITLSVLSTGTRRSEAIGFIARGGYGDSECWVFVLGG